MNKNIKEIITWSIIILIAWFVFGGGLDSTISYIDNLLKSRINVNNNNIIKSESIFSCSYVKEQARINSLSYPKTLEAYCNNHCNLEVGGFSMSQSYTCENNQLICRCTK